jgi:hypothetical protein
MHKLLKPVILAGVDGFAIHTCQNHTLPKMGKWMER